MRARTKQQYRGAHAPGHATLAATSLGRGLCAAFVPRGGRPVDLVQGLPLTPSSTAREVYERGDRHFDLTAAAQYYSITTPANLKLTLPITIVCRLRNVALVSEDVNVTPRVFGVTHSNAYANPWDGYLIYLTHSHGPLGIGNDMWPVPGWNSAGTWRKVTIDEQNLRQVKPTLVTMVLRAQDCRLFYDAVLMGTNASANSNPTYGATSTLVMGEPQQPTWDPVTLLEYGLIYNRALTPAEIATLTVSPYAWLRDAWISSTPTEFAPDFSTDFGPILWVEFDDPDGTTRVFAQVDLADPGTYYHGFKAGTILDLSRVTRALSSDDDGSIEGQRWGVTFADTTRYWRGVLGRGDLQRLIVNQGVRLRMISDVGRRAQQIPRTVALGLVRAYEAS